MASGRTPLMAGNWKMNLDHLQATHLVQKLDWTLHDGKHDFAAVEVVVLPPFTDLRSVQTLIDGDQLELRYGAQDLSVHDSGAYTGEVSGAMLAKLGCTYVVVGHSERREYHAETDEVVNAKVKAAFKHGAHPDPLRRRGARGPPGRQARRARARPARRGPRGHPRRAGRAPSSSPTSRSGRSAPARSRRRRTPRRSARRSAPGWPSCTAETLADGVRILYGGSVKSGNIASIMAQEDVDGALVGGASLEAGGVRRDLPLPRPPRARPEPVRRPPHPEGLAAPAPGQRLSLSGPPQTPDSEGSSRGRGSHRPPGPPGPRQASS